jgi:aminoglycoside 6'-N-acetyltransferase
MRGMELRGERVTLRTTTAHDREALKRIREEPEVLKWWEPQSPGWPGDEEDVELLTVTVEDGTVVGLVQFWEDPDDDYRHADVDILLTSSHHDRGLGTDAMRTIAKHLTHDRGHHRITLTTSPENARAIHVYEKVGFRTVGVTRKSERRHDGRWYDELLMEYVIQPVSEGSAG